MDLTIIPPPGYHKVENARWTWADPNCDSCHGTGLLWNAVWQHDINSDAPTHYEDNDCPCQWSPDEDVLEQLYRQYQSWGNQDRAHEAWEGIAQALGPRRPGGTYWCGYWRQAYTVVEISYAFYNGDPASPSWTMTVEWDGGRRTTHHTPWEPDRDSCHRPPMQEPGPAPAPPELHAVVSAPASQPSRWSRLTSCRRRLR